MPNPSSSTDTNSILEVSFKDLLDKMLTYFEKFIKTPDELAALENKLNDYHNLIELVEITKDVFTSLTLTIDEKLSCQGDENYEELEKVVQKHEGEIRNHIRIEQQLKLYSESIQAKLDDSEKGKTEMFEETKSIINNLKKENEKLVDSLKQKSTEYDTLNNLLKKLQDENKQYKEKLQELPFLQERIINLEKQTKAQTSSRPFIALKDASPYSQDNENLKKLDFDMELSKIAKPDSTRKSVKSITTNQQQNSPLKFINKTTSGTSVQSNKNKDYIKVKVDVNDGKHRKELEALKSSYQKFYNPIKAQPKERTERARHATSVNKTRELKSIYSIPLVTHSSNTSLIHGTQQMSHREQPLNKIHQRSSSYGGSRSKSRASIGRIDDNL